MNTKVLNDEDLKSIKLAVESVVDLACGEKKVFALMIYDVVLDKAVPDGRDPDEYQSMVIIATCPGEVLENSMCMTLQSMGHYHDDDESEGEDKEIQH